MSAVERKVEVLLCERGNAQKGVPHLAVIKVE